MPTPDYAHERGKVKEDVSVLLTFMIEADKKWLGSVLREIEQNCVVDN